MSNTLSAIGNDAIARLSTHFTHSLVCVSIGWKLWPLNRQEESILERITDQEEELARFGRTFEGMANPFQMGG